MPNGDSSYIFNLQGCNLTVSAGYTGTATVRKLSHSMDCPDDLNGI